VHTSTVTVSVLQGADRSCTSLSRSKDDLDYRWFAGTGKGGQHRNKHQNCLELTHVPTGVSQTATGRSRAANEREALDALWRKLDELEGTIDHTSVNQSRSKQIGSGMRGDKIRTYRFQDDQINDHRTGKKCTTKKFMKGAIDLLW
jgi:peptide chain release factor 1